MASTLIVISRERLAMIIDLILATVLGIAAQSFLAFVALVALRCSRYSAGTAVMAIFE